MQGLAHAQPGANERSTPPQLISKITITYPENAKANRIEGKVWLALLIDSTGAIEEIKIDRSDNPLLDQAAIDAMKHARFQPATFNGVPEKVWYQQALTFKLSASDTATIIQQLAKDSPPQPLVPLEQLIPYPSDARQAGIEGSVSLQVLINEEGKVEKIEVENATLPIFEASSVDAMNAAAFKPAIENGAPARSWYKKTLHFDLPSRSVPFVVGLDSNITAAPELLEEIPVITSMTIGSSTRTTIRVQVSERGLVKNAIAIDRNVDAATSAYATKLAAALSFAPGLWRGQIAPMWTDVTFHVIPAK